MSGWANRLWRRRDRGAPSRSPIGLAARPAVVDGWNGLAWGSSVAEFRHRFPDAGKTDSGWWVTGQGPEQFLGIPMAYTQYGYNSREQLFLVSFIPEPQHRALLTPAALNTFGAPPGYSTTWRIGDVVVEVKTAGVVVTLTHERYARHT